MYYIKLLDIIRVNKEADQKWQATMSKTPEIPPILPNPNDLDGKQEPLGDGVEMDQLDMPDAADHMKESEEQDSGESLSYEEFPPATYVNPLKVKSRIKREPDILS